jgi:RNA polymerase sigma factor (sigma-70 family)
MPAEAAASEPGERLALQAGGLRLLLHHLAGRAVRAHVEIDDLLQETFLRALSAAGGLPPVEPGEAALHRWLGRLARHVVIDAARALRAARRDGRIERLGRSDWSGVGASASRIALDAAGPATRAALGEETARLVAAYERLAPDHRRVLGLRRFEGLDARETGRRMGRSEAAVHSLYRRALLAWEEGVCRG